MGSILTMRYGAIDIGNSRVKILTDTGEVVTAGYSENSTDELRSAIEKLRQVHDFSEYRWGMSSVVPWMSDIVLPELLGNTTIIPSAELIGNQRVIDVANVHGAGHDRIFGLIGALRHSKPPLITVDCGTAITINYLDGDGIFQGGAILPGLSTSLRALHERAAQLPLLMPQHTVEITGKTTAEAMAIGNYWGACGAISMIVERICFEAAHSETIPLLMTGGDHELLQHNLTYIHSISVPYLVLEGIRRVVELQHITNE
jgi:pantothenate kinase type III